MNKEPINPSEWVIQRVNNDLQSFRILLENASLQRIARLRVLIPEFGARHPKDVLAEVRKTGMLDLGVIPGRRAFQLNHLLTEEGFHVQTEDASFISHAAINHAHGYMMHIESLADNERFCLDLIAAGASTTTIAEG